jgi:hypothetical protein
MKTLRRLLGVALALAVVGCTGSVGDGTSSPGSVAKPPLGGNSNPTTGNPGSTQVESCAGGEVSGRRLLRRLTGPEFEATVRTTFNLTGNGSWVGLLPPDPAATNGFSNNSDRLTVGTEYASAALDTAKLVGDLVADDAKLASLLPCASTGDLACANSFLDIYGLKLYRRPLSTDERAQYTGLYTKIKLQNDFKTWVYWTTVAMLQSPNVLYRSELGEMGNGGLYQLTPYEVASALAFTFSGAPPSDQLMKLAATNMLSTPAQLEAAARGLMFNPDNTPRPAFVNLVLTFAQEWLGLESLDNKVKDATAFPDFGPAVQTSMAEETRQFIAAVIFGYHGKPADLYLAPFTYVDSTLAKYYGFGSAPPSGFGQAPRPAGWGLGVLGQGSLLAVKAGSLSTSPTKRGHLIRTQLLCYPVPSPPAVVPQLPDPTAANTTRERYEKLHAVDPLCKGCHQMMDPIGFGLEHLDAAGRYRATENNFPIDATGTMLATTAGDLTFDGADQLSQTVARLPEAASCLASFIASYSFGVDDQTSGCMVHNATTELLSGRINILDYYAWMAKSEHFRTRTP